MTKSYTWAEVKNVLIAELEKTQHILTCSTIGSCNINHDIDTIITKKSSSSSKHFFQEVHQLLGAIDKYLTKKHSCRLIRACRFSDEEEIRHISRFSKGDLVFHVLTYVSFSQIEKHWHTDLGPGEDVETILNGSVFLLGEKTDLYKKSFKNNKCDYLFIRLNDSDRINAHFPDKLLISRMNILFDFILRKRLGMEFVPGKTKSEIKERFYEVCEILDRVNCFQN
jgi:hypothetical protein